MPERKQAALDFLLTRRSRPAKTLTTPVPDRDELTTLLTAGARTPDHGKLEPWRFIVLERPALERLAGEVTARGTARGEAPDRIEKVYRQFADSHLAVAVVAAPDDKWGEVPAAFIELREGASVTEAELVAHCREHLASYKLPKKVLFSELPKTSTGKIQKFVLRERMRSTDAID